MTLVATDAIVLHAFDYRETSRILRVVTREHGVRSVIARGARRPRNRFGPALDLFAEGQAQLALHPSSDLHTLASFDVTRARPELAESWGRFSAANALAEMLLRFARDDEHTELFDAFRAGLDSLGASDEGEVAAAGLGAAWSLVAHLGFGPALEMCASCDAPVPAGSSAPFAHRVGGVLCGRCAEGAHRTRVLPASARVAIAAWAQGRPFAVADAQEARAHLRLIREFLQEHLGDERALRAFAVWERNDWGSR